MVIMKACFTMQPISTALELNIFQKKLKKFIGNESIMCGCFCIQFIDFMPKGKNVLDYTNLFTSNEYEKNDKRILKYFQ